MAKAKDCNRCGRRFLAEANELQLCILCHADFDHERLQLANRQRDADELDDLMEGHDDGDSRKIPRGNDVG